MITRRRREKLTANSHLPHTSQKLDQTTVRVRTADHNAGNRNIAGRHVDQGKDEGRQGEGGQSERSRVGKLAEAGLVRTGLEGTSPGGHQDGLLPVQGEAVLADRVAILSDGEGGGVNVGAVDGGGGRVVVVESMVVVKGTGLEIDLLDRVGSGGHFWRVLKDD